jgi:replicative DNA helicase
MGIRYDSHIMGLNSLDCFDHKAAIQEFYKEKADDFGRLRIKYYPTSSVTAMTLRGHIEKLATQKFRPDVIVVDYAGIMRSSEHYDLLRMELKKVMEELRQLATELDVPIWTAIQSNKEGAQNDVVDLTNMAEGYGQAHVADFVVGLSRKSAQKANGFGNIFIAKNRAGVDGIKYQIHLDTAQSRLRVLTDDEVAEYASELDSDDHSFIRRKLREMQSNKSGN